MTHITSGAKVQIVSPNANAKPNAFISDVYLMPEPGIVLVRIPVYNGKDVSLGGGSYTLRFLSDSAIFRHNTILEGIMKIDALSLYRFKLLDEGEKMQRRDDFRFACNIPVEFAPLDKTMKRGEPSEGMVNDLSAGGIKMMSNTEIETGVRISIEIQLDNDYIVALGEVRAKSPAESKQYKFQYGVKFHALPKEDKDIIIQYVSRVQRKLLMKVRKTI